MTKEALKEAIDLIYALDNYIDECNDLGLNFVDTPLYEVAGELFDLLIESNYTDEGQDWINWFVFERSIRPELKAYDEDGTEICKTFDELYEYVKQFERKPE